jgi:hypothetical protein
VAHVSHERRDKINKAISDGKMSGGIWLPLLLSAAVVASLEGGHYAA